MRIGVVELDHHRECLNSLCQILDFGEHDLTVYTTKSIKKELESYPYAQRVNWQLSDKSDVRAFINKHHSSFEGQELLIFSTAESEFKTWNSMKLSVPRLVRIHNANTFLKQHQPWFLKASPYWLFKDTSYVARKVLLENEIKERNTFLENTQHLCFTSNTITDYVLKGDYRHKSKVVEAIPITFNEFKPKTIDRAKTFAVIGTIDRKRKDYNLIADTFKSLKNKFEHPVNLLIMGKSKGRFGKEMINRLGELNSKNLNVRTWPNGVSQQDFDKEMQDVDVILAPIFKETKYFLNKELYGFTKISGSVNDSIKYARVGLLPDFYPVQNEANLFYTYRGDKELEETVLSMASGKVNLEVNKSALENFALNPVAKKTNKFLDSLVRTN